MEEISAQAMYEFAAVLGFQIITVKNTVSSLIKILSEGEHPFAEFGHLLGWLTCVISWE